MLERAVSVSVDHDTSRDSQFEVIVEEKPRTKWRHTLQSDVSRPPVDQLAAPWIPALPAWAIDWPSSISHENALLFHICFIKVFSLVL